MLKISVVTVCYNAAATIEETIQSVLNQTYPNVEYIIIDGGSTDGTVDIIKKYADRVAYWISEPDKGIYDAMNKGIAAATGDYINFMNAGDRFTSKDTLTNFTCLIKSDTFVAYGDCNMHLNGNISITRPVPITYIKKRMPFCHQSCFVNTTYHKTHLFDTSFKVLADYNMFYNAYYNHEVKFQYIPLCVADYDIGIDNASSKYYKLYIRERYRIWGIECDMWRKIPHELRLVYIRISNCVKRVLPTKLVIKIKMLFDYFRPHENIK